MDNRRMATRTRRMARGEPGPLIGTAGRGGAVLMHIQMIAEVTRKAGGRAVEDYAAHVNPQWVRLLQLLQMDTEYVRCEGVELTAVDGRMLLDFLSGYCVHNTGHNHPYIIEQLRLELERRGPAMLHAAASTALGALPASRAA